MGISNLDIQRFDVEIESDAKIRNTFSNFLKRDVEYREQFLQKNYTKAFDGYSFMGQKDSSNQYEKDRLHSFVISEFNDINKFPIEFHDFLQHDWKNITQKLRKIEIDIVKDLGFQDLINLYEEDVMGHMMTCNFYPKPSVYQDNADAKLRLSSHKDISLFTIFPYGISKGFSYLNSKNENIEVEENNKLIVFSGYFLEFMTGGSIEALDHRVDLPKDLNSERYSFALFSIPKPNKTFLLNGEKIKSEEYYKKYLSLF